MSRRRQAAPRADKRRQAPRARDAVEAMLRERLGFRGFRAALEVEAAEAASAAEREPGARRDLTALQTFTSTRRPPATSTTRCPPASREA